MDDWYLVFDVRNGEVRCVFSSEDEANWYVNHDDDNGNFNLSVLKIVAEIV